MKFFRDNYESLEEMRLAVEREEAEEAEVSSRKKC